MQNAVTRDDSKPALVIEMVLAALRRRSLGCLTALQGASGGVFLTSHGVHQPHRGGSRKIRNIVAGLSLSDIQDFWRHSGVDNEAEPMGQICRERRRQHGFRHGRASSAICGLVWRRLPYPNPRRWIAGRKTISTSRPESAMSAELDALAVSARHPCRAFQRRHPGSHSAQISAGQLYQR